MAKRIDSDRIFNVGWTHIDEPPGKVTPHDNQMDTIQIRRFLCNATLLGPLIIGHLTDLMAGNVSLFIKHVTA